MVSGFVEGSNHSERLRLLKNIAMMAGAVGDEIQVVAKVLVEKSLVRIDIAQEELAKLRNK
ncbi:hypothetical protein [Pelistega sp. MC2]|uniref:hypothetical protein n=1 Tax=Pelistega sp. MC2 TaxID=1720297 RepID=UPI0008D96A8A|nr:hypothetical protein [Pelistega sp. MC2]